MTDTENTFGGFTLLDDEEEFDELCLLLCGFQFAQLIVHYGSVKSYAQICFGIWQKSITGGRLNRPLVTLQQAGRKGSRAAVRRSSCP